MILVNSVFKYVDIDNGERIRIIETDEENAYVVNIDSASSMPKVEKLQQLEEEIDAEKLVLVKDPFSKILEDKELTEVQIKKRDLDWQLIEKYWEDNKGKILQKSYRSKVFKRISDESGVSLSTVKKLFSRFLQRGMNKNALLPDYINSGARG